MSLFGTAGIRGDVADAVTPEVALAVGRAVGYDARERGADEVVVGLDGRVTGPALSSAVEAGLLSTGVSVRRVGQVPTPALAYASRGRVGVMLTASHNPPSDNGIKLFADGTEFDASAEEDVERRFGASPRPAPWDAWERPTSLDVLDEYRTAVAEYAGRFGSSLEGLPIALDCGNGMASLAVPQVMGALGGEFSVVNGNVDGHFPGRDGKPTRRSLRPFSAFVAEGPFELGLAHDGDADRIVVIDSDGTLVHEDTVLAVLAERYVRDSDAPEPVVVTTPNASGRIDERVSAAGGRTTRVALGSLADGIASVRDGGGTVAFAAEPWKHVHTGFGGWIDGVASAAVLARLVAEAGDVESLTASVTERPYRKEAVACPEPRKDRAMDRIADELPRRFPEATVDREYGVRLDLSDGAWILVRPSGTEPLIRLYAESDDVKSLLEMGRSVVETAVSSG